jgi:hypothetical protein
LPTTSEMMLFAAMVHLMVRRLEPKTHTGQAIPKLLKQVLRQKISV